jgi:hypothetical protein
MEPASIVSLIISTCLILERCFKHIKKSKCCGAEFETYEEGAPYLSDKTREASKSQSFFKKKPKEPAPDIVL